MPGHDASHGSRWLTIFCWMVCLMLTANALLAADGSAVTFRQGANTIEIVNGDLSLPVSLLCPVFTFNGMAASLAGGRTSDFQGTTQVSGDLNKGEELTATYAPIPLGDARLEVKLHLAWSAGEGVLRKWAEYRFNSAPAGLVLHEIRLDTLAPVGGRAISFIPQAPQSHPGFFKGFFAGIEFPVATTRMEGSQLVLAHRPGLALAGDSGWRKTRVALFGPTPAGRERETFAAFINAHRPTPHALHFNYNSWWTSPVPYSEQDILALMKHFEDNLTRPYGVSFQTFTIDMGWSDKQTLWDINTKQFPQGFSGIEAGATAMGSRLGLWISPTSCYPGALDNDWAKTQGYETMALTGPGDGTQRLACLGGAKYAEAFKNRLVELATRYGIRHFKFDGYGLTCPETDHGHEPGEDSVEACAEGGIRAIMALCAAAPDTWIETTCFGYNPSPWWLYHVNSVIGSFGDDSPPSRVPAPVWRECATTGRDFYNLQGAALSPLPDTTQEVLGIIHQTDHPLMNDAVTVILRGHAFVPMYINPKYMNERRWAQLAGLMKWARTNEETLAVTEPILPPSWRDGKVPHFTGAAAMPREPYGYAHWNKDRGLVLLRNPWVGKTSVRLSLGSDACVPAGVTGLSAVGLYPEPRLYGQNLDSQSMLEVPLAPYETVVLNLAADQKIDGLQPAGEMVGHALQIGEIKTNLKRIRFTGQAAATGPDWTAEMGEINEAFSLSIEGRVTSSAPETELLVLLEGKQSPAAAQARLEVNGREAPLGEIRSDAQWTATMIVPLPEAWTFLTGKLEPGENKIRLTLLGDAGTSASRVACWAWARKPGDPAAPPIANALPVPEQINLDSAPLLESQDIQAITAIEERERPVTRFDGIYLDALTPVSVTQGWGKLQKNQSVWEKPLTIGDRHFSRGLGTHATARIVYDLAGLGYTRFQSWVGADAANSATITFTVLVDGRPRFESGLMTRADPARRIGLDVSGAKTLELQVGDGGNGIVGDHADFGDALLRR